MACSDLDGERANLQKIRFGLDHACSFDAMLHDDSIEIVVNLTPPQAHAGISLAAIDAGKSVYSEKPMALTRQEARLLIDAATRRGVHLCCAPDTILGAGVQHCRELVQRGEIGTVTSAVAHVLSPGHESWHPNPAFFYQRGGGPLMDMGPYFIAALAVLLGPVRNVAAMAQRPRAVRTIPGDLIEVEVPTHVAAVLGFEGALATLTTSFDVLATQNPYLELHGSQGTLVCPDPSEFSGLLRLWKDGQWKDLPSPYEYQTDHRGIGVVDLACALRLSRNPRMSSQLGYHIVDTMEAIAESAIRRCHIPVFSSFEQPAAMPCGKLEG